MLETFWNSQDDLVAGAAVANSQEIEINVGENEVALIHRVDVIILSVNPLATHIGVWWGITFNVDPPGIGLSRAQLFADPMYWVTGAIGVDGRDRVYLDPPMAHGGRRNRFVLINETADAMTATVRVNYTKKQVDRITKVHLLDRTYRERA